MKSELVTRLSNPFSETASRLLGYDYNNFPPDVSTIQMLHSRYSNLRFYATNSASKSNIVMLLQLKEKKHSVTTSEVVTIKPQQKGPISRDVGVLNC